MRLMTARFPLQWKALWVINAFAEKAVGSEKFFLIRLFFYALFLLLKDIFDDKMDEASDIKTGDRIMLDMRDEKWIRERYEEICRSNPEEYMLISLKIKRFRVFNRLFGREAGDKLIEKVYHAISLFLKEGEYLARIGGDYYNLLVKLPGDYDDIFHYIIDLNAQIRDMPDEESFGKIYTGMGLYLLTKDPADFLTAQYNADICRSESKESLYRNTHFEIYGMTYWDKNLLGYDLEQTIRPAMENGDFKLYLQPKVDLKTGRVSEAEALVRWIDPERGMIPVSEFLPELEKNGLIDDLDLYTFEKVCRTINRWIERYGKKIRISVNLSSSMFNYRYFFEEYKKVFEKNPCPRECIEFEFLESIVLNQVELVSSVVEQVKEFGFGCSLDDFGSGYSSFSVLTNTKLDTLKIDRSLFQNESDPREKAIVRHIIETAKELRMRVIAEGVETKGYVDFLKELQCDCIQGFVFYKPMPVEEFEEKFVKNSECAEV